MNLNKPTTWLTLALAVSALASFGCGGSSEPVAPAGQVGQGGGASGGQDATAGGQADALLADLDVGVPIAASQDPNRIRQLVASSNFGNRRDPFALLTPEARYNEKQSQLRVFDRLGGFTTHFEPPVEEETIVLPEPQPYRRLSGIIIGDSVYAIIDMGDGASFRIIYPGAKIEGTDWTVVSIDQDRAILRRPGNRKPTEIIVRLENSPNGPSAPQGGPPSGGRGGRGGPQGGPGGLGAPGVPGGAGAAGG